MNMSRRMCVCANAADTDRTGKSFSAQPISSLLMRSFYYVHTSSRGKVLHKLVCGMKNFFEQGSFLRISFFFPFLLCSYCCVRCLPFNSSTILSSIFSFYHCLSEYFSDFFPHFGFFFFFSILLLFFFFFRYFEFHFLLSFSHLFGQQFRFSSCCLAAICLLCLSHSNITHSIPEKRIYSFAQIFRHTMYLYL